MDATDGELRHAFYRYDGASPLFVIDEWTYDTAEEVAADLGAAVDWLHSQRIAAHKHTRRVQPDRKTHLLSWREFIHEWERGVRAASESDGGPDAQPG